MTESKPERQARGWRAAYYGLLIVWVGCGVLVMNKVRGGFLTNYGADVTQPAWLYIVTRGLDEPGRRTRVQRWFGTTPERAAMVIFLAAALTEVSQRYWPAGVFPGRFDPLDIVAYAVGVGTCYAIERFGRAGDSVARGDGES
jgi:hypothetical protein